MIKLILIGLQIVFMVAFIAPAQAKNSHKSKGSQVTKKALPGAQNGQLGTNFSFEAASVHGKYQMAGQGVATVEDEKVLDDLLGLRRQFKDREQQEASRR